MSIFYNQKTIVDGLVLALDAGNIKSYPGSGTTWTDIIGRGNTGTLTNSPTYSSQNGGSIVFNGDTNYVENLAPNLGISGDTSVTLSCWFYNSVNSSDNQALLVYGNGSTGGDSISILLRNLSFYASFNGGLDAVIADNVYALNTWNNVVVTKTPGAINTTTKLYLNGVEQTITSASSSTPSLSSRVVRVARWTDDASPYYFLGGVSAALIYNRALSAAEVLQNYNSLKNRFVTAPVLIPVKPPYQISRSLRFNSADSAYLSRTPTVAGNRKTWTWAGWVKRSDLAAANSTFFRAGSGTFLKIGFQNSGLCVSVLAGVADGPTTSTLFRDASAWYHIVVAFDTTQSTPSDRTKLYVNGQQVAFTSNLNWPSLNTDYQVNSVASHNFGDSVFTSQSFNGYLADVHLIDGQALTPSSFTETNATTGQLVPKAYTGTYGTNGFRLNFSDNSAATAATLGADSGGGISAATGALPIYNTTDNYGITKGTGTRTDSNAASLVLAIPMDGANNGTTFTDESATIKGSGSAKTVTRQSDAKTLTAQSKFYGSSGYLDGTGDAITVPAGTDFAYGTGNFTIEGWFYQTRDPAATGGSLLWAQTTSGSNYFCIFTGLDGNKLTFLSPTVTITGLPTYSLNTWNHFAVVRSGTSLYIFVNGVGGSYGTTADNFTNTTFVPTIGRYSHSDAQQFQGYVQDFRVYKGVAKYTSNFTPSFGPNNWTPNNLSVSTGGPYPIATSTGALPVYNTTDTYGAVKGTGTRTDSNASSLVLAIPMDGANNGTTFTDESANIKGSGSAKTITNNGSIPTLTAQSKFYGSSAYISNAATQSLTFGNYGTDFQFTGDFTIECWVYPTTSGATDASLFVLQSGGTFFAFNFDPGTQFNIYNNSGSPSWSPSVSSVITGQWNHLAFVRSGSTQQIFVNGVSIGTNTASGTLGYASADFARIGGGASGALNSYIQDLRIYKGVAKYTSNFTPPSATQNTTVAAGCDSLTDTPTSYGTDLGNGGEVRGNYATLNPLGLGGGTLSNGNLTNTTSTSVPAVGTFAMRSGKWYWEVTLTTSSNPRIGVYNIGAAAPADLGGTANGWCLLNGPSRTYNSGSAPSYGAFVGASGSVVMVAYDADAGKIWYGENGSWLASGSPATGVNPSQTSVTGSTIVPASSSGAGANVHDFNFGQRPFAYAAPSGFKALCDTNLPTPTIAKPNTVMDVKLWAGDGSSSRSLTDLNFSPDFLWVKSRNQAYNHTLFDVTRGAGSQKALYSNTNESEASGNSNTTFGYLSSFDSNGFSVVKGSSGTNSYTNHLNDSYVAWAWDAGSSTVTNTAGTISSQVRANASAGFSVVSWTGTGASGGTIGHGLNVVPEFIICKSRTTTTSWPVYHKSLNSLSNLLELNTSGSTTSVANYWGSTAFTSNVFNASPYGTSGANWPGASMIAYCFAPVTGYSAFGSYTGNGSTDGPFVYTGFRPRWLLFKNTNVAGQFWDLYDTARDTYNASGLRLFPNSSNAEGDARPEYDILSNGFKVRDSTASANGSGNTIIYAAFAENPFQYSRAR